jgi:hypothetical protein
MHVLPANKRIRNKIKTMTNAFRCVPCSRAARLVLHLTLAHLAHVFSYSRFPPVESIIVNPKISIITQYDITMPIQNGERGRFAG